MIGSQRPTYLVFRTTERRSVRLRHIERRLEGLDEPHAAALLPALTRRYTDPIRMLREIAPAPSLWVERVHAGREDGPSIDIKKTQRAISARMACYADDQAMAKLETRMNSRAREWSYRLRWDGDTEGAPMPRRP